ncbi:MAG TPA: glycosyltransferase family 2 protein [Candidatus Eisenbacteria bacterium]|nr:glycosyltransferase family 2 protein [Candidatus Eisenbacteria bacterium]
MSLHVTVTEIDARAPEEAPFLTVLVPCYDEKDSLRELHREISDAVADLGRGEIEILYVDDGSRDGSDRVIAELAAQDPRVRGIVLRANFGKSAALATGFRNARGRHVATLDADLQDDPAEIPRMLQELETQQLDLVTGWKQQRQDPLTKTLPSKLFNAVTSSVSGLKLHDYNCGFKLYRRDVTEALEVYGELHRFLPALAHWKGFRVGELPVHHRARRHGRSKFGPARFVNGFLDLLSAAFISKSALKPLHVFGRIGLLFLLGGVLIGLYFVALWIAGEPIRVRPLMLFGATLALMAFQFILMGLLGEMIAHQRAHADYPVRRRVGFPSQG